MSRGSHSQSPTDDRTVRHASTASPERVVARAASAAEDVEAAAAFVDDGGLAALRAAVERADPETALRGRRALAAFEWVRWAARTDGDV